MQTSKPTIVDEVVELAEAARKEWANEAELKELELERDQALAAYRHWKALAERALDAVPQDHPDLVELLVEYDELGGA